MEEKTSELKVPALIVQKTPDEPRVSFSDVAPSDVLSPEQKIVREGIKATVVSKEGETTGQAVVREITNKIAATLSPPVEPPLPVFTEFLGSKGTGKQ
jgi:hypothetical protein